MEGKRDLGHEVGEQQGNGRTLSCRYQTVTYPDWLKEEIKICTLQYSSPVPTFEGLNKDKRPRARLFFSYAIFSIWNMQALTESSDLEALRREKRAIIEEERCLKALMDIEKSSGHRKAQMLAALRAEKQRHAAKADYRRRRFTDALESHFEKEAEVLREKHGVAPK